MSDNSVPKLPVSNQEDAAQTERTGAGLLRAARPVLARLAVISFALTSAAACVPAVFPEDTPPEYEERPVFGRFGASFDQVWDATTEALDLYPVEINEKERGLLVTEWIIGTSDYVYSQYGATRIPEKIKYRIRIQIASRDGMTVAKIVNHEMVEKDMISGNLEFSGAIYNWIDVPSSTSKEREILEKIRRNLGDSADLDMGKGGSKGSKKK